MHFFVLGVSHHQAPVAVREKFAGREGLERLLYDQQAAEGLLAESLVLSTCNRLEILAVSERLEDGRQAVLDSLAQVSGLPVEDISPFVHEYSGLEAARYLFRVAASLDSLVLGEPQILGQVKDAFRQALTSRRAGPFVTKLMHKSFRAAKRIRSETSLAGGAVSVAGAAVALARTLLETGEAAEPGAGQQASDSAFFGVVRPNSGRSGDLRDKTVLLLGAGPMAALAAANLTKRSPAALTIMNRTSAKAAALAGKHNAAWRPWEELNPAIMEADLIIAATGAQEPILTLPLMAKIMALRARPLTIIDIGVPRNASPHLNSLDKLVLRNIDDLNEVVYESRAARQEAARRAEALIDEEVEKFGQWLEAQVHRPTVTALTRKAERIRRLELTRTLEQHQFTPEQAASLEVMTSALVRRLLHDPLAFIKSSPPDQEEGCGGGPCRPRKVCLHSLRQAFKLEADEGPSCG